MTGSAQMVVGAIGVAEENNVLWFGTESSQTSLAPSVVVASQVYDWTVGLNPIIEKVKAGTFGGEAFALAAEVEQIYKEAVREFKISAALLAKEEDAKKFEADVNAGKPFVELAKAFQEQGRAKQVEEGAYLKLGGMDPQYGKVVAAMTKGSTSAIVQTKAGFAILRLDDIRYGENPEEKERARQVVLDKARKDALRAHDESLKKKFVKVNREVLDSIDYEAEQPGFEALRKDTRVVAEIKGDKPITVGDLTEQMRFQFFHGLDRAAERKKLNARKEVALDGMLIRYDFMLEGFDKVWTMNTKRNYLTYTHLPPGEYSFKVYAINKEGLKSTSPAVFSLKY